MYDKPIDGPENQREMQNARGDMASVERMSLSLPESIRKIDYTKAVMNALIDATDNPAIPTFIYQREGFPVRIAGLRQRDIIYDPKFLKARIEILNPETLQYEISQSLSIIRARQDKTSGIIVAEENPPLSIIKNVLAASSFPFKELAGILKHPTINAGGDIIAGPYTYDETSQLFITATSGLSIEAGTIPENPSETQIQAAKDALLGILENFPFVSESDRANALALFFTVLCRPLIAGLVPTFMIQAPAAGTGKTLLANTLLSAAMGAKPEASTLPDSEAEIGKVMLAKLMEGSEYVFFDNLEGRLKSGTLCGIITSGLYEGRLLGLNKMVKTPVIAPLIFTGNNPVVTGDMPRRIVPIRLDAGLEDPTVREGFRYPNLEKHLGGNRSRYICAGLTLAKAWVAQGWKPGKYRMASFNDWATTVGGILDTAGISGFLENLKEYREAADPEKAAWQSFVLKWYDRHGEEPVPAADLKLLAQAAEIIDEKVTTRGFGRYLGQKRNQIIAGFKLDQTAAKDRKWYLIPNKK
jgi:hypothetical protein